MKKAGILLILIMGMFATAADAQTIFVDKGCVKCHSVTSANIQTTSKKEPEKVKDLSDVGNQLDKAFLSEFLLKKKELEGKLHKNKFSGDSAELETLMNWLITLKKAAK